MAIDHKVGRWVVSLRDISWAELGCEKRVVGEVGGWWMVEFPNFSGGFNNLRIQCILPQLGWGLL